MGWLFIPAAIYSVSENSATGDVDGEDGEDNVGGMVGRLTFSSIAASYATGSADGGADNDNVGGLVGHNDFSTIYVSHADTDADGGSGRDNVGGLVGYNDAGHIIASYANGGVVGGPEADYVGGLVGSNDENIYTVSASYIVASYATANTDGGEGSDSVGGLAGYNSGTIDASYATGSVDGGAGEWEDVGGLVGHNNSGGRIQATYATGNVNGGAGDKDIAGSLVGWNQRSVSASYGFGTATGERDGDKGTALPRRQDGTSITSASQLGSERTVTTGDAGTTAWWNSVTSPDEDINVWDFGTSSELPALVYVDYDGAGSTYASCDDNNGGYPDTVPATTLTLICGRTLIGNFRP